MCIERSALEHPWGTHPAEPHECGTDDRDGLAAGVQDDEPDRGDLKDVDQAFDDKDRFDTSQCAKAIERCEQHGKKRQMSVREGLVGDGGVVLNVCGCERDLGEPIEVLQVGVQKRLGLGHTGDEAKADANHGDSRSKRA